MYKDGAELKEIKNIEHFNVESQSSSLAISILMENLALRRGNLHIKLKNSDKDRIELELTIIEFDGKNIQTNRVEINIVSTKTASGKIQINYIL